jgi:hypothetical protein
MKTTLAIAVLWTVLNFGCGSSGSDSSRGDTGVAGGGGSPTAEVTAVAGPSETAGTAAVASAAQGDSSGSEGGIAGTSTVPGTGGSAAIDPCPDGVANKEHVIIKNAAQLAELAHCTTFKNLTIMGSDITNLDALANVTTVTGYLFVRDTQITDLQGLDNLIAVGENLYIGLSLGSNEHLALTSLHGLENLRTIGGSLQINGNASLTDISALDNLTSVGAGKMIQLRDNPSLPTCDALKLMTQLKRTEDDQYTEICGTRTDSCGGHSCPMCYLLNTASSNAACN